MDKSRRLLDRLDAIGHSLDRSGHALALIGLGSVGLELARLDEHSDRDFFAIVEEGCKRGYLDDLSWLSALCPIAYCFRNTDDGCKLLFADDIFCEFAVFELPELRRDLLRPGRIVWKQPHVAATLAIPAHLPEAPPAREEAWLLGEALTNLYVGLERDRRGETLSALRFIQQYAVDRLLELAATLEPEQPAFKDSFTPERRFEQRYPSVAARLPAFMQGYRATASPPRRFWGFWKSTSPRSGDECGAAGEDAVAGTRASSPLPAPAERPAVFAPWRAL
jgi:hypothetical protein